MIDLKTLKQEIKEYRKYKSSLELGDNCWPYIRGFNDALSLFDECLGALYAALNTKECTDQTCACHFVAHKSCEAALANLEKKVGGE